MFNRDSYKIVAIVFCILFFLERELVTKLFSVTCIVVFVTKIKIKEKVNHKLAKKNPEENCHSGNDGWISSFSRIRFDNFKFTH